MSSPTLTWWSMLCTVSVINVVAWAATFVTMRRHHASAQSQIWPAMRLQLGLSAGYVLGCAYRSAFPVFDVQRLCLVDSWFSSVIVGRSVATAAELCFAAQWALLLRGVAVQAASPLGVAVSRAVIPLIVVAELCSWYAVLTTSNIGHVVEESIWGLCAALLVTGFVHLWPRSRRDVRPLLLLASAVGVGYVIYMFKVDVPMYWARWRLDIHHAHVPLSIAQGLADASGRWVVSQRWSDWRSEVVWMSLYFSVAVWLSIGMIHVHRRLGTHPDAFARDPVQRQRRAAVPGAPRAIAR